MGASRTTKPLTAHPAFPVIVALWFAALLGLGTYVVPPANFEGLVVGTGLARLLPAAAPPLGDTARLAISGIAALLGALLGLAIAARIRRVQDEPQTRSEAAEPATDSPWLADDDDASDQDVAGGVTPNEADVDERAVDQTPGKVPARLARRHSTSERDDLLPDLEIDDEAERIYQASEIHLGDAEAKAEADSLASQEAEAQAEDGETGDVETGDIKNSDGEDDDLQRFAADRLVAGLPRVQPRNFDDDPLEDWSRPDSVAEEPDLGPEFATAPEPVATESLETESQDPDFDGPELVEEAEYEELPAESARPIDQEHRSAESFAAPGTGQEWSPAAGDTPAEPSWAADVESEAIPETPPLDFSASSLSELVARFDAALAVQRSQSRSNRADPAETQPEPSQAKQVDDPVIAFLRREADRDRGAPGEARPEQGDDPRAGLRNALEKLDRVSRKS